MAAKDLQIIRTRAVPTTETAISPPPERASQENPAQLLLDILKRQWMLLALIAVISGGVGFACSYYLGKEMATAHITLIRQPLPPTSSNLYEAPPPEYVASLARRWDLLGAVQAEHGLDSVPYLLSRMRVKPDSRAGALTIDLTMDSEEQATKVLATVAGNLEERVVTERGQSLRSQRDYITAEINKLTNQLDLDRREKIRAQLRLDRLMPDNVSGVSRKQFLMEQEYEAEEAIKAAGRREVQLQRNATQLLAQLREFAQESLARVQDGRRQQLEALGAGLRDSTRTVALREQLLNDLAAIQLDEEFADELESETDPSGTVETSVASESETDSEPGAEPPAGSNSTGDPATPRFSEEAEAVVAAYSQVLSRIREIGAGQVGPLDEVTGAFLQTAQSQMMSSESAVRGIENSILALRDETDYLQQTLDVIGEELKDDAVLAAGTVETGNEQLLEDANLQLMKQDAALQRTERNVQELRNQIAGIDFIVNCPIKEYVSEGEPRFNPEEDKDSNHLKLFVLSGFGCAVVLLSPVALMEWLRMRPEPVTVVSRRWNLPVLGIQSASPAMKDAPQQLLIDSTHSLRLMALRIQQSLYQPNGKVVLFSGLDHEDSPLLLIREIAKCLSQREETVLILQTLPCQVELARKSRGDGERIGRPGVAEYLAGEFDDVSELVINTGISGVDFLPGGCTLNASEAMASSRLTSLIEGLRDKYSTILMCGPPTLNPADLQMLAARADGIVFTVTRQSLRGIYGEEVINDLIELGAPILGFAEQAPRGKHQVPALSTSEAELQLVKSLTP